MPLMLGTRRVLLGGRPFQPTDIAGLMLWLAADRITGLVDSDPVGTWSDLSGNANDATQGTAAAKPAYRTGIVNGRPAVRFDGVDDILSGTSNLGITSGAITLVAVVSVRSQPTLNTQMVCLHKSDASTNVDYTLQYEDQGGVKKILFGRLRRGVVDEGPLVTTTLTTNAWYILEVLYDGVTVYGYINGALAGSAASSLNGTSGGGNAFAVGRFTPDAIRYWSGDVAESLIYNNAIAAASQQQLRSYLSKRYEVALS